MATISYNPRTGAYEESAGGGGGFGIRAIQTDIDFDTPEGLTIDGVVIGEMAAGESIYDIWISVLEAFDGSDPYLTIVLDVDASPFNIDDFHVDQTDTDAGSEYIPAWHGSGGQVASGGVTTDVTQNLRVISGTWFGNFNITATQGKARVTVFIASAPESVVRFAD